MFNEVIQAKGLTYEDLNTLYRSIIKAIYYIKDADDDITIDIVYK